MILENTLIVVSFLIVLISIRGEFWNNNKRGVKKISLAGWITILFALTSCSIGLYRNYRNQQSFNSLHEQKMLISETGYKKIFETLNQLLYPFSAVHRSSIEHKESTNIDYSVSILYKSSEFIQFLDSIHINDVETLPFDFMIENPEVTWRMLFIDYPTKVQKKLTEIWILYGAYFDVEIIRMMDELLDDWFFKYRLLEMQTIIDDSVLNKSLTGEDLNPSIADILFRNNAVESSAFVYKRYFRFIDIVGQLHRSVKSYLPEGYYLDLR